MNIKKIYVDSNHNMIKFEDADLSNISHSNLILLRNLGYIQMYKDYEDCNRAHHLCYLDMNFPNLDTLLHGNIANEWRCQIIQINRDQKISDINNSEI